jgi:hypothetical protein
MEQIRTDDSTSAPQRALLLGHFSTVGDIQCLELVGRCLANAGLGYDVAAFGADVRGALRDSISPDMAEPHSYTHLIVVCGPCWPRLLQKHNFDIDQYRHCKRIGINLTMVEPLSQWNPFDALIERDSDAAARPDLAFMVKTESIAVLGRCLIRTQEEYGIRQKHSKVVDSINDLIERRRLPVIDIDTRWPRASNASGIESPAEVSALINVVDTLITNRLHGLVFALRNGVPVLAVDSVAGGDKVTAQARILDWPVCLQADEATPEAMDAALDWCLTADARAAALRSRERALHLLADIELQISDVLGAVNRETTISSKNSEKPGTADYFPFQSVPSETPTTITPLFRSFGAPFSPKPPEFLRVPKYLSVCAEFASESELEDCARIRAPFGIKNYASPYTNDIVRAFRLLKGLKSYVEVWTFDRGNLAYVASLLDDEAVLVGVDTQVEDTRDNLLKSCLKPGQRYMSVVGNSLSPQTLEQVNTVLDGKPIDAVFIDGEHTAYAVLSDYVNYGSLVVDDGFILFHDSLWEGDNQYKGSCDALAEIDRLNPIYLIPGDGPCHRFMRPLFRDPIWGVVGVCRKISAARRRGLRSRVSRWLHRQSQMYQ